MMASLPKLPAYSCAHSLVQCVTMRLRDLRKASFRPELSNTSQKRHRLVLGFINKHTHTHIILKTNFYLQHLSYRLESGGSNPTSSDSYSDRASARARREAREARLASLTIRVEEDTSRDYKKVVSLSRLHVLGLWYINLLAFLPIQKKVNKILNKEYKRELIFCFTFLPTKGYLHIIFIAVNVCLESNI